MFILFFPVSGKLLKLARRMGVNHVYARVQYSILLTVMIEVDGKSRCCTGTGSSNVG